MKNSKLFIIMFFVFVFDRLLKFWLLNSRIFYYPIIKNYLSISSMTNTGAAFSLFQNYQPFIIAISILVVVVFVYYYIKKPARPLEQLAWGFLLGGALGNLYDRLVYHCVIDYINIECLRFPVFNFADIAITLGALLICVSSFFPRGEKNV